MKTLLYEVVGDVMVLVHGEPAPADVDWEPYVRALDAHYTRLRGALIVNDGAGPNGGQRGHLNEIVKKHGSIPTAVVTHSAVARGIVTALGWFQTKLRAFAPNQLSMAMTFLGVDPTHQEKLMRRVVAMRLQLASQTVPSQSEGTHDDEPGMGLTIARLDEVMSKRLPALRADLARRTS